MQAGMILLILLHFNPHRRRRQWIPERKEKHHCLGVRVSCKRAFTAKDENP